VILGVSRVEQLEENLKALDIKKKLTEDTLKAIEEILSKC
jgi:aryl-alcohol dehydrogenase-like predicted oxidoreductase